MSFFDSEIVRAETAQIQQIQEEIMSCSMRYQLMTSDQKLELIAKMEELLDKQRVLHARIKLSEDSEAKEMLSKMRQTAYALGIPKDTTIDDLFVQMEGILSQMKSNLQRAA